MSASRKMRVFKKYYLKTKSDLIDMPINADSLKSQWAERVANGLVNDFLCPAGHGTDAWVGQCLYDSGRWTVQVRPTNPAKFLETHTEWMALDANSVFRNFGGDVPLEDVCVDISAVVATMEADIGPLELVAQAS